MTTDQLVALLVADLRPVNPRRVLCAVIIALAAGLAAALGATMLFFVFPLELLYGKNLEFLSLKLLFASGIVATAAVFLPQLAPSWGANARYSRFLFRTIRLDRGSRDRRACMGSCFRLAPHDCRTGLTDVRSIHPPPCDLAVHRSHLGRARRGADRSGTRRRRRRSCCWRPRSFCVRIPLYGTLVFVHRALVWPPDRHMRCHRGEARSAPAAVVRIS
jgi:hypothetical protein